MKALGWGDPGRETNLPHLPPAAGRNGGRGDSQVKPVEVTHPRLQEDGRLACFVGLGEGVVVEVGGTLDGI